ncbi:MAG: hypothetical protein HUU41_08515 [Bryobacteraceae bacterium]|nr:hypothetical protein [Bryobacterales bacterium]NUN01143.1 hypothetical protein [Bryobacteraceae bacterium]
MRIAAAFSRHARVADAVDRMIAMQIGGLHDRTNVFKSCDDRGCIGVITGPEKASNVRFLHVRGKRVLAIAGIPVSLETPLATLLNRAIKLPFDAGLRQFTSLDGSFAAILWDGETGKAGVVTDFIGLEPLYVSQVDGALLLATSIRAITASGVLSLKPDAAAWGAFLSFGHFLGDRTSVQGVRRVPAASVYVYDTATGQVDSSTYWDYPRLAGANSVTRSVTRVVMEGLERSVKAYLEHSRTGTLLLSGGFDSRLVLGGLLRAKLSPHILVMDHPDEHADADGRFARRVAKQFGLRYERFRPVRSFYDSNEYVDYVVLNEVSTASLYLYIAQLASCLEPGITTVWEGLVPGATLNPPGGSHGANFSELLRLRTKGHSSTVWRAARMVFSPSYADELYQSFLDLFQEEAARYEDNGAGTSEFMIRNRMRNRTGPNPVKVYAARTMPFLPGMTREFFEAAAKVPYNARSNHRFFLQLYRNEFPEAMKVPFCSGGELYRGSQVIDPEYWSIKVQASRVYKRIGSAVRARLGKPLEWWDEAPLVDAVVQSVAPESEHLNRDTVSRLQRGDIPEDTAAHCKAILFYWQMSKWVMDGTLAMQPEFFRESLPLKSALKTPIVAGLRGADFKS